MTANDEKNNTAKPEPIKKKSDKKTTKKRTSKIREECEKLREENTQLKDQLLRKMAEFDNFRKRTTKDYTRIIQTASENVLTALLPVLDDLERSLEQPADENNNAAFRDGIEMIYNKLVKTLEEHGLKVMETDGKEFNPELHEALMQMDSEEVPSSHIIQTFEKGYSLNNKVIRHAKVGVSK